jgi:hypothetical protein
MTARRSHFLPPAQYQSLERCAEVVNRAFDDFGCFLVGSVMMRRDYRDVDVRCMLSDSEFDRLFPSTPAGDALWSFVCWTTATWMRAETGLPVDFQIQRQSDANEEHGGLRSALGCVRIYPGELPSRLRLKRARRGLLDALRARTQ